MTLWTAAGAGQSRLRCAKMFTSSMLRLVPTSYRRNRAEVAALPSASTIRDRSTNRQAGRRGLRPALGGRAWVSEVWRDHPRRLDASERQPGTVNGGSCS